MADILIKGMEMPKVAGRTEAIITILKDGTAQIAISPADDEIGYWKEYPLIPVPPHGRLIDADALVDWLKLSYGTSIPIIRGLLFSSIIKEIQEYPSVIPAKEGK